MKTKTFDCVNMKHRGAAKVRQQTAGMTPDEEMTFWRQKTQALQERQQKAHSQTKSS